MTRFLADSGYEDQAEVRVITDVAKDLVDVADKLPHARQAHLTQYGLLDVLTYL